ncbi:MAG: spore coat protein YlbD [Bacilli bacterium]
MDKKEQFREFARNHSNLASYVKDGSMTWQKFYELYDIYGEDESIWKEYKKQNKDSDNSIKNIVKNLDVDKIEEHLQSASKALDLIAELTKKDTASSVVSNVNPRPITNFFKD